MHRTVRRLTAALALGTLLSLPAVAQIEIQWGHSMSGALGEWINDLAGVSFNPDAYVPALAGYYTAPSGQMLSGPALCRLWA